jgi:hypothetical protein
MAFRVICVIAVAALSGCHPTNPPTQKVPTTVQLATRAVSQQTNHVRETVLRCAPGEVVTSCSGVSVNPESQQASVAGSLETDGACHVIDSPSGSVFEARAICASATLK